MAPKKKERKRGKKEGGKLGGCEERKEEKEQNSKVKMIGRDFQRVPARVQLPNSPPALGISMEVELTVSPKCTASLHSDSFTH